jgi:hypothetical protein
MKRLFRWKAFLIVASSSSDALFALNWWIRDFAGAESGDDPLKWLDGQSEDSEVYEDKGDVDPVDYLHAVPPNDIVDLSADDIPRVVRDDESVDLVVCDDLLTWNDAVVMISLQASAWAEILPVGFVVCTDPNGPIG